MPHYEQIIAALKCRTTNKTRVATHIRSLHLPVSTYEGMFILDSNRYSKDSSGVSGQISDLIQKHGGEVIVSRLWEERKLAYPINGQKKGTYWLTYFKIDSRKVSALTRDCEINDNFLRQMFVCPDPRVTETLINVAQGRVTAPPAEAAPVEA